MSGYNRTSGQSYNYSQDGTFTDQYGNVIGTTGNSLDRAYYYWQSRAGSGAFTQVGEGLDRLNMATAGKDILNITPLTLTTKLWVFLYVIFTTQVIPILKQK